MKLRSMCAMAVAVALLPSMAQASLLSDGAFEVPDAENWSGSAWGAWGGPSGRATWADRGGSGRGAAGFGWSGSGSLGFFQDAAATYGVTYTFSIWVKREVNYNEDYTEIKLEWRDSGFGDLGDTITTNITGLSSSTWTKFTISGKTTNTACANVRPVVYTQWSSPTNASAATIQFDDAEAVAAPATVIQVSRLSMHSMMLVFTGMITICPLGLLRFRRSRAQSLPNRRQS